MSVERREKSTGWVPQTAGAANDNAASRRVLAGPLALIYRPAKSAMTSGRANTRRWVLEFEPQSPPFIEPLMGWTGSTDPLGHMRLSFPSQEAAVAFAERQGLAYELRAPRKATSAAAERRKPPARRIPVVVPVEPLLFDWPQIEWTGIPVPEAGEEFGSPGIAA